MSRTNKDLRLNDIHDSFIDELLSEVAFARAGQAEAILGVSFWSDYLWSIGTVDLAHLVVLIVHL